MNFEQFQELKTERLLLRKIELSDSAEILFLRSNEIVNQFIERPESRKTKTHSDAVRFINEINEAFENGESITWGIALNKNPKIIGTICLWNFSVDQNIAEVGYDLNPEFHGMGVMSEALKNVIIFGFNKLNLSSLEAFTDRRNRGSKRLLEKIGFQPNDDRMDKNNSFNEIFEIKNLLSGT
ncbi:GNAT family N-acetyltransferase [Lutimonas saemankumensis]|uniref:GNAT family N-acetyltransferase n=1 Tax=Lutimonas saemankumensis TaxID=483016 RepID=UPI001CD4C316|nr:GNAT family N-acetyltransferase [Lutimonas saemankumensis]MCA0931408.1 GNAT family N-acetyltransferase [Lutimonas saemankumensis]